MFAVLTRVGAGLLTLVPLNLWQLPVEIGQCVIQEATIGQSNIRLFIFVAGGVCGAVLTIVVGKQHVRGTSYPDPLPRRRVARAPPDSEELEEGSRRFHEGGNGLQARLVGSHPTRRPLPRRDRQQ